MDWTMRWTSFRDQMRSRFRVDGQGAAAAAGGDREATRPEPRGVEDWSERLVEEGVAPEWAKQIAKQLEPLGSERSTHGAAGGLDTESLIRGAAAASHAQAEARAFVERNMRDVREVERLLGAFSGELEKLDEVLEVLAAYAQRMRNKPPKRPPHTLH